MKHLAKFLIILADADIPHEKKFNEIYTDQHGIVIEDCTIVKMLDRYTGFYTLFIFDQSGELIKVGIFE